jgi:hypothetical protein
MTPRPNPPNISANHRDSESDIRQTATRRGQADAYLADALRRDVRGGALVLDEFADAVGVIGLVGQHDGARAEMIEQVICDLPVMRLSGGQAEPDREPLRVDDDMDLGREPTSGPTETMIWPPFLPSQPAGALG